MNWSSVRLRYVANARSGASVNDVSTGSYPYMVVGAGGLIGSTRYSNASEGDIVVGRVGSVGSLHLLEADAWATDNTLVLSFDRSRVDPRFGVHSLAQIPVHEITSGTAMPLLTAGRLLRQEIRVPPLDAQQTIADYLDRETARIDELIAEQGSLIEMLAQRRAAVISHVLAPQPSWSRKRVKHVARTDLGKMLDAGRSSRAEDVVMPYVRAADIWADGTVNLSELNTMPFSAAELLNLDLRAGDVLLIEGGATVGRPGLLPSDAPGIAFQKTVNRLRSGPELEPRFAYWSLLALYQSGYYSNYFGSVSFVHLTGEKLREVPMPMPDLAEQRRISDELDEQTGKIDTLIAEAERFIELSRERRSALITAAVTGQIDVTAGV